jgi:hypothetical protein
LADEVAGAESGSAAKIAVEVGIGIFAYRNVGSNI